MLIGILFTYQGIRGYIYTYIIYIGYPDSYRVEAATYFSNLINGNLLIISSLFFFTKKSLGALFFQYTGISFMLYAANCFFYDIIVLSYYDGLFLILELLLLSFGLFLFFFFKRKNHIYKNTYIIPLFIIFGVLSYLYIDLFLFDWSIAMQIK